MQLQYLVIEALVCRNCFELIHLSGSFEDYRQWLTGKRIQIKLFNKISCSVQEVAFRSSSQLDGQPTQTILVNLVFEQFCWEKHAAGPTFNVPHSIAFIEILINKSERPSLLISVFFNISILNEDFKSRKYNTFITQT